MILFWILFLVAENTVRYSFEQKSFDPGLRGCCNFPMLTAPSGFPSSNQML
ncbi:hypothetical protein GcM1_c17344o14 [Golovinomyces cichoracearum]|uniref:Uncharacterized protein n=1 Tax=Golovinomyces cichoracearum TaxID=62708 RepID=A0A420IX35_9PEZI|nr:hypothetical protein GcM1_c17344o14 [Golovinomyces cichoracearum]